MTAGGQRSLIICGQIELVTLEVNDRDSIGGGIFAASMSQTQQLIFL